MTALDAKALRALHEAATPGPWRVADAARLQESTPVYSDGGAVLDGALRRDALLIAAMRNQLPALLDRVAKLEADVLEARAGGIRDVLVLAQEEGEALTLRCVTCSGEGSFDEGDDCDDCCGNGFVAADVENTEAAIEQFAARTPDRDSPTRWSSGTDSTRGR